MLLRHIHATGLALVVLSSSVGLSSCSNLPGSSDAVDTAAVAGNVFSNNNELDYDKAPNQAEIAPSDVLDIKVFQAEELSGKVRVESNGTISLPLVGSLKVAGMTPAEAENHLKTALKAKYLQDPQVTIFLENFTSQRITLEGEFQDPGIYPISGSATLLQSIALAGGLGDLADPDKVVLLRRVGDKTKAYNLRVDAIRNGQARDPYLLGDDRIIAHRSGSRYWIREVGTLTGAVRGIIGY